MKPAQEHRRDWSVREVPMGALDGCVDALLAMARADGFAPQVVLFLERAGRLPGVAAARRLDCPVIALHVRRSSTRWKTALSRLAARLPRRLLDRLRMAEAGWTFRRRGPRELAYEGPEVSFANTRLLILDDAADTGSSLLRARDWAEARGAARTAIRVGVIACTSDLAGEVVDYSLYRELCRFPWSSDSVEQAAFEAAYASAGAELVARRWAP